MNFNYNEKTELYESDHVAHGNFPLFTFKEATKEDGSVRYDFNSGITLEDVWRVDGELRSYLANDIAQALQSMKERPDRVSSVRESYNTVEDFTRDCNMFYDMFKEEYQKVNGISFEEEYEVNTATAQAEVDNDNKNVQTKGDGAMNISPESVEMTEAGGVSLDDFLSKEFELAEAAIDKAQSAEPYVPESRKQSEAGNERVTPKENDKIPKSVKGLSVEEIAKLNFRPDDINSPEKVYSNLKGMGVHCPQHVKDAFEKRLSEQGNNPEKRNRICAQQMKIGMAYAVMNNIHPQKSSYVPKPQHQRVNKDGKPYNYDGAYKAIAAGAFEAGSVARGENHDKVSRVVLHVAVPDHVLDTKKIPAVLVEGLDANGKAFVKTHELGTPEATAALEVGDAKMVDKTVKEKLALGTPEAQAALDAGTGRVVDKIVRNPDEIKAALESGQGKAVYTVETRDPTVLDINRHKVDKYFVKDGDEMRQAKDLATFTPVSDNKKFVWTSVEAQKATYNADSQKWEHNGEPIANQRRFEKVNQPLMVPVRDKEGNPVLDANGKQQFEAATRNQRTPEGQFIFVEKKDKDGNPVLDANGKSEYEPLKTTIPASPTIFNNINAAMDYATKVANNPTFEVNGVEHKAVTMGDAFKALSGNNEFYNTPQLAAAPEKSKSADITDR